MANLIDQMNILKGLTDEHLASEVQAPSGSAPPFLVLGELNRRKDMRERYQGDLARKQKSSTVADDIIAASEAPGLPGMTAPAGRSNTAMSGGIAAAQPGTGGGIAAAAPQAIPAFADGGMVDAGLTTVPPTPLPGDTNGDGVVDYQDLIEQYQTRLNGLSSENTDKTALKQALIQAGLGIMGGGHASFFRNLGEGGAKGIEAYNTYEDNATKQRDALTGDLTNLELQQHADALRAQETSYQHGRDTVADRRQALIDAQGPAPTADQKNFADYSGMTPDQRALYQEMKRANAFGSSVTDPRLTAAVAAAQKDAADMVPKPIDPGDTLNAANNDLPPDATPDQIALIAAQRQAAYAKAISIKTYELLKVRAPEAAVQFALDAGLTPADIGSAAPATPAGILAAPALDQKDPLGLGL